MKSPFAYYGGKTRLAETIVRLMPPHRVYIEPFAGSLAVLFAKAPAVNEIVNDVDGGIVTFFRALRDQPQDLERVCRLTPYARDEFDAAAAVGADTDLEVARRFWVRVNQSFAKTAGPRTGWSITTARTQSPPDSVHSRIARFAACAERLSRVSIEHCDAADLIERLARPDAVVYADPPYLSSTRSQGSAQSADYMHDMGSVAEHERLAEVLHKTPAHVFLSGYRSGLYDQLYRGWERLDITVHVGSSNSRKVERRRAVESIWSNRPIAAQGRLDIDDAALADVAADAG